MIISDKELGLAIIYLQSNSTELAFYKNKITGLPEYIENLSLAYHTSPNDGNSFKTCYFPEQEDINYFEENFKIVEIENISTNSTLFSDKCNIWFEADEEVILYWNLKYSFKE